MRRLFTFSLATTVAIVGFAVVVFFFNKNLGKGALQVTSEPNSQVYLDGKLIGQTPLCKCELPQMLSSSEYTIKLTPLEGNYVPFEQKIKISPKVLTVVDRNFTDEGGSSASVITLDKLSNKNETGLTVISFPSKAKVFLDGNEIGETPLLTKNITESDHEIKLTKKGYKDKIIRIRAVKGYKLEALIYLGVNPTDTVAPATSSAKTSVVKVLILQTPTGFLRVRSDPSLDSQQIGLVNPGEKYDFLEEKPGWLKIKLLDGNTGWVSSQYAEKQS